MKLLHKLTAAAAASAMVFNGAYAFAAESVDIPAKSVYVFSGSHDNTDTITTPILKMTEKQTVTVTSAHPLKAIQIYKCDEVGKNAELIYENRKNITTGLRMPVSPGECYYITIEGSNTNEQLIIK